MDPHGEDWRAEHDRRRSEARRRYSEHLRSALDSLDAAGDVGDRADAILDSLFVVRRRDGGDECRCSCHPQLPTGDLHEYGFACPCQHTAEERVAFWDEWQAEHEAYLVSPEGRADGARRQAEEDELVAWTAAVGGVVVESHGGLAPEQWTGTVDGHSFYFRERHELWHVELDLRPTGRFCRAMVIGDTEDDVHEEMRAIEEGDLIAEGTTNVPGYGRSPVERAEFLVGTIREHLRRVSCVVHTTELENLGMLLGRPPRWCPDCGQRLYG